MPWDVRSVEVGGTYQTADKDSFLIYHKTASGRVFIAKKVGETQLRRHYFMPDGRSLTGGKPLRWYSRPYGLAKTIGESK